ncbi:unnamed protein product, partial [Wuchereria bancrofti]
MARRIVSAVKLSGIGGQQLCQQVNGLENSLITTEIHVRMLPLLLLLVDGYFCNDTPFVINRVTNRVEFSELLLGYNYDHADNRSVEVTVSFAIRHIIVHSDTVSLSCEIFQKWRDSRLKYSGIKSTTIPKGIKIWRPDTNIFESVATYGAQSFRLYSDGTICWKQRATLTFPCISYFRLKQSALSTLNCSLIIGSFDNSGAESIMYRIGDIMLPSNLNPIFTINYTIATFEEIALNGELVVQTAIHFLIESDQIDRLGEAYNDKTKDLEMDLKQVLLPIIIESRRRFGDNSLLLVLDSVKTDSGRIDPEPSRKILLESAAGLNKLELLEVSSGNSIIQGYAGEIRYWQTKLCQDLDKILVNMFKIDNLDKLQSKILQDVSVWKRKNDEVVKGGGFATVLCFSFSNDNEYIVPDSDILTFLKYSLQVHFETGVLISVEEVEQIALPAVIFRQLWVAITESKFIKISIKLYDFDGFECGYISGINFSESIRRFPEEGANKAYEKTHEKLGRYDNNLHESHVYDIKRIKQEIQSSTKADILDHSSFYDDTMISESIASEANKLSIINKIRKAVEAIVEAPCNDDRTSFISLGFDSLKLAKLEFVLEREFSGKFSIPYGSAHRHPNISALTDYILKSSIQGSSIPESKETTNFQLLTEKLTRIVRSGAEIPLSAAQKRLIFLYQLDIEHELNFAETLKFSIKSLKIHQFQRAFNKVVARHTALRTIYTLTGQTILSLTEAYFWISAESEHVLKLLKPIDLFDSFIPIRIFVTEQEDNKDNRKLKKSISNQICQEKDRRILGKDTDIKSSNLIVIQIHHIMIDGFSIKLLTDELRILCYEKKSLRSIPYQYGHFVLIDQQRQDSENRKLYKTFWKHLLLDVTLQKLPVDETGLQVGRYSGRCLQFKIDSKVQKSLQNLAIWCSVTQFSVLLTNFQLLQYKRYGFKDCCIGIITAQRETSELCTIIGCLLNVVPLINTINPNDRIHDFITKSYKRLNESIQKQLQFDDLIAALRLERDLSNSPLFQVLFISDDSGDISYNDDGNESNFAQYDQVWYFQYHSESMRLKIEYNSSRFYKSTIETMVQQYFRLIHKMSQNLHMLIEGIKMVSSMEKFMDYKLRLENRCDFPQKCTVLNIIDEQNKMNFYGNTVIQRGIPFSNVFLQQKSNQLSRFLTQRWLQFLGEDMRNDSFMLLILDRSVFLLLSIFSLWKCGIGVAPLNLETSLEQLNEILAKLPCPAVIYERKRKENNATNQCISKNFNGTVLQNSEEQNPVFGHDINEVITLISGYSDQELRKKLTQHNLAYMTFTSGSTGTPKGICTEFYGLNNLALNYAELLSIKSSSIIYQVVNPSFDIFFADILEAQTSGAGLYLASQRIPNLEEMSKVTHAYIMPAYLSAVEPEQFKKLENLEKINFGGDYIQYKVLQDAIRIGLHFHNQYGMTEHSIYSTCKLMKVCDKTSSVGKPLKNIFFSIYDGDENSCGQHITGICCSSGAGISRGYHDNENLNQISFLNNNDLTQLELLLNYDKRYFYSGDLAQIKSNVGELLFHGRSDFQVKIRGMQVDIPTIEAVLGQNHLVKECIVCLRRTETEEFLIAYIISCNDIITDKEKGQLMTKSLSDYMLGKLPDFMIPSHYVFVQQFPLNINGKINRKLLPVPEKVLNSKIPLKTDYIFEAWEKQVIEIFAALLPGKAIQIDDSFFEAGGDSLKALIAIQNIKRETGMDLQLRDIFKLASFRDILERLKVKYSIGNHKEVENLIMLKSTKFRPNVLHGKSGKLTDDQLVNDVNISDNMDNDRSLNKKMSWKYNKIYNSDKKSGFWFNGTIPVSLQQERLLFLYSFGKEYRESYKLQFLIKFYGSVDLKVLNTALNYIMRKHRLLRTVFFQKVANVIQEVTSLSECYIKVHKNVFEHDDTGSEISSELPSLYDTPLLAVIVSGNLKLMLILDHLIVDGRSIAILTNDLVEFYNILINRGNVSFDFTEGTSYAEFCLQQRKELEKFGVALKCADCPTLIDRAVAKNELEVQKWLLKLRNFPPLSLQGDLSNEEFDRKNNVIKLKIPLYLSAIKHFCVAERCTLFAYLLGVFSLTVRSVRDQQKHRFAVVTSALNRTSDTINCVGLFVNTVIIPIDTAFDCVSELIHSLQQNITEALQFQHIPFDYIIRKLNGTRSSSGTESYQVSFVVQNASATKLARIDGAETIVEEINAKYAKFDQAWYCTEFEDYIEMSVEYKIEKYSDSEIKHAMELFVQIASQLLSNRSMKVKGILKSCELIKVEKPLIENDNPANVNETQGTIKKSWMLEEVLLSIWKEVLECSEISVFDNFFAIGGHSLLIPSICYKIEQQVNYQCPPQAIFKYQTVRELAQHISSKQDLKILATSNEKLKIRVCPLQESLVKMYYNVATETSISTSSTTIATVTTITTDLIKAYQTGFSISLKSINFSKLRHSLNLILMRHFALRATFYCQNNDFFQQIHSGTEIYITPRKTNIEGASLIVPNPFHAIPILCWLTDGIKQELLDDSYYEFHFKISHIICDGKSLSIIARELSDNYFEDRHISVKDDSFIQFSRRLKQRFQERYTEMQRFWSQNLNNTEGANLHYEKITATVSSNYRCKFFYKKFKSLNILIKRVAKKCCCSPFIVQLAAFSKVLSGIATQDSKMIISCPVDMRDSKAQQCVGMCINVLPVIINFRLRNYQDLIQDIAKSFANAYINADISNDEIEKLCEKYGVSNFADIMIVNNYKQYSSHCYQILNDNSEFTKCTLTLFLTQYHEDIEAKIECKQDFFYDESMKIMLNQWAKTIRRMEKVIVTNDKIEYKERRRCPHEIFFSEEYFSAKNMDIRSKERLVSSGHDNDENVLQKNDYPAFSYQHLLREAFVANRQWATMTALTENNGSINYRTLTGLINRTAK